MERQKTRHLYNELAKNMKTGKLALSPETILGCVRSLHTSPQDRTKADKEIIKYLLKMYKFSNSAEEVCEEHLDVLSNSVELIQHKKNDKIIQVDDPADCVYLIFSGRVGIMVPPNLRTEQMKQVKEKAKQKADIETLEWQERKKEALRRLQQEERLRNYITVLEGGDIIGELGVLENGTR